jgi:hypothetical protein
MNWVSPGVERTLASSSTTVLTNGTNSTAVLKTWRDGQWLNGEIVVLATGAGDAAALTFSITHKNVAVTIDTASLAGGTATDAQGRSIVGYGQWRDAGTQFEPLSIHYASTTTLGFAENSQDIFGSQLANTDSLKGFFRVPIVGWT